MLNPLRDNDEGVFMPEGRGGDTCDQGLSRELESKSDGLKKRVGLGTGWHSQHNIYCTL